MVGFFKNVNTLRNRGESKNCQKGSSKYHKEVEEKNTCFGRQLSHVYILCSSDKKAEIDSLAAEYIESVKNMLPEERVEHLKKIQSAYSKCKEYSDDKVQLAMQTYEMVRITTSETFVKNSHTLEWGCRWAWKTLPRHPFALTCLCFCLNILLKQIISPQVLKLIFLTVAFPRKLPLVSPGFVSSRLLFW